MGLLYLTVFTHCLDCHNTPPPSYCETPSCGQEDPSPCPAQSFILRQLEPQKLKAIAPPFEQIFVEQLPRARTALTPSL